MLGKADIPSLNKNQHDLISLVLTFNRYLLGGISLNNEWFCEIKVSSDTLKLSQIIISSVEIMEKMMFSFILIPASICLLKINNINTRLTCEICSKLTIKTSERCQWPRSGGFIVNFEHISHLILTFLLLTLSRYKPAWNYSFRDKVLVIF